MPAQRPTKTAQSVSDQLASLPDAWLLCRDLRAHAFDVIEDYHLADDEERERYGASARFGVVVRRLLTCLRCDTHAADYFVPRRLGGYETLVRVGSRRYEHPDGYMLKRQGRQLGAGLKMSDLIKAEAYRRATERLGRSA